MKGLVDEPNYMIELLEGGASVEDVIDGHIYEQALAEKSAFVVADLGALMRQHAQWLSVMPRVRPFYPLRCNSSPAVIEVLASLGVGFVCANKTEITRVLEHGVAPENIILSGVCKQLAHIKHAAKSHVAYTVCESEAELGKIARAHPGAKLLLQLATEAHAAETSMAFGSSVKSCRHLLEAAKSLGVEVVGVAFHVPSSCRDLQAYSHALSDVRCVFDMGEELGFSMTVLDIGGGFSGSELQLRQVEDAIAPLMDAYFPPLSGVQVIAELGGYYVSSAFTMAVNVIGKKAVSLDHLDVPPPPSDEPRFLYCMSEGVYGCFAGKLLGNTVPPPLVHKQAAAEPLFPSSLWGPSCDPLDQVVEHCLLPELSVGDWLVFGNMGACSLEDPSNFSDADRPPVFYTISAGDWYEMQEAGVVMDSTMKNFLMVQYSM